MRSILPMCAALLLVTPAIAAAGENTPVAFAIGGESFELPLPTGYCPPSGRTAAIAQLLAAGDTQNVTHAMLVPCGQEPGSGVNDYTLVKTPSNLLIVDLDRAALLAAMGPEFDKPDFAAVMATPEAMAKPGEDMSRAMGAKVELTSALKPVGHDSVCAYLGGTVAVKTAAGSYDQPVGGCLTAVGKRFVAIYRYGKDGSNAGILTLLRQAKVIALTIRTKAG